MRMRRVRTKMKDPTFVLTFVSALGCGLVAGIFFAFSSFVMRGLAGVPPTQGIAAKQSINVAVLNRWFFAVFFGTAACCLLLAVASFFRWQKSGAAYLLIGGLLYLVGTILVTMICNVPLNDKLAAVDPTSANADGRQLGKDNPGSSKGDRGFAPPDRRRLEADHGRPQLSPEILQSHSPNQSRFRFSPCAGKSRPC